ncbi:HNH endonuclease [Neomegalonema perideroedes]|uniref:HNH endonuclease n=1 Tax=Neomegalonema perideroedes TaxID=217219 RepID=UPI000A01A5E5|nr:HNH endonuclease [Neomegalonema perideroedes]
MTEEAPDPKTRNPPWTRDELLIALDLYLRHRPRFLEPHSPEIQEASALLNRLGAALGVEGRATYRNANGVAMKLMNLKSLDPTASGKGLSSASRGDAEVWAAYAHRPAELAAVVARIREGLAVPPPPILEEEEEEFVAVEGRLLTRLHRRRERDPKIVRRKKEQTLKARGALACAACGFDFQKTYGDLGAGFLEAHHTTPLSEAQESVQTKLADLALLCANCHRMIHRAKPWLSVAALKALLEQERLAEAVSSGRSRAGGGR